MSAGVVRMVRQYIYKAVYLIESVLINNTRGGKTMSQKVRLATVPNNAVGKKFIRDLRGFLNTDTYRLRLRGRGSNRREKGTNTCLDLKLVDSERLAIYLEEKPYNETERERQARVRSENFRRYQEAVQLFNELGVDDGISSLDLGNAINSLWH